MIPSPIPTSALQADPSASFHASIIAPETVCEREKEDCCTAGIGLHGERELEPVEARLVELMRQQWLGPQDALRLAGCFSLAQRVSELKREHGLPIVDEWRQVGRSRFKVYKLVGA